MTDNEGPAPVKVNKLFHVYRSGNYYRLEQLETGTNMLQLYFNDEYIGEISFLQIMRVIKDRGECDYGL